jgi:hypothetical protein
MGLTAMALNPGPAGPKIRSKKHAARALAAFLICNDGSECAAEALCAGLLARAAEALIGVSGVDELTDVRGGCVANRLAAAVVVDRELVASLWKRN